MEPEINVDKTINNIKERMEQFYARNVPATASYITTGEINQGRKYTFDAFKDEFYGYQWSAILDTHTCNYCTSMDGRVIGVEDKAFSEYKPGEVHFGCRCIWVGIMKEEVNPPPFTGIPDILVPQTEAEPWNFRDLEYPLVGSGGRRTLPYGLGVFKDYPGLPKDVQWITKDGKHIPIDPKTNAPVGGWKSERDGDSDEDYEKKADETAKKLREDIEKDGITKALEKNNFVNINEARENIEKQDPKALDRFNAKLKQVMDADPSGEGSKDFIGGQSLGRRILYIYHKTSDTDIIVGKSIPWKGLAYRWTVDYFRRNDLNKSFIAPYIKKSE